MNTFKFVGNLILDRSKFLVAHGSCQTIKFGIKAGNNIANVELKAFPIGDTLMIYGANRTGRISISPADRFNDETLSRISFASKYITNLGSLDGTDLQFVTQLDFLNQLTSTLPTISSEDVVVATGTYEISEYKGKYYNNFELKTLKIDKYAHPELTLQLDLFYNHDSLDESDKVNRFILNSYIQQYNRKSKSLEYYPLQTQFDLTGYDFKNENDIKNIKYRKSNIYPSEEEGYVKSTWECQYVKGAQLITPPLDSLPEAVKFEIQNSGRELKEYMRKVVGESRELICLIRPDNTKTVNNAIYTSLNISNNEFISKVHTLEVPQETLDNISKKEATNNPFNF